MTETANHPAVAVLRRLSTLRKAPAEDLEALSLQLYVEEGRKGSELLALGADDKSALYLLEGSCRLVAQDGGIKIIRHTDPSAQAPLARLRPSHYRVVAESPVRYLRIDDQVMEKTIGADPSASAQAVESYEVEEQDDLGHLDTENRLTLQIYEDLNSDNLLLPSLPDIAIRIGEAVSDPDSDARSVAKVIESDPAIALKIVKAANSARYGGVSQLATVTDAVARLGLQNTRFLVVSFALRELFLTNTRALEKRMFALWEHSRRVAALTQVLSERVGGFSAHEALLAGLVHDIGVVAVISYARDFPDIAQNPMALEASIGVLRTQLSGMILSKWKLPGEIVTAAKEAENWYRDHAGKTDYADLVIAAQLHEGVAGDIDPARISALRRIGVSPGELGEGIELLHEAREEVEAARRQLTG